MLKDMLKDIQSETVVQPDPENSALTDFMERLVVALGPRLQKFFHENNRGKER